MPLNGYILLIEDEAPLAEAMADILRSAGYQPRLAVTGQSGLRMLEQCAADLIILDHVLPDMLGLDVLRRVRQYSNIPVIVVSGRASEYDKIRALEDGADDFLAKPFYSEELRARIAALLRRANWGPTHGVMLEAGPMRMDMARRQVTVHGRTVHLTPVEYAILTVLLQRAGEVVSYKELMTAVWGPSYEGDCAVLRVNISRLRQKVEQGTNGPDSIQTIPRKGYRITN